MSSKSLSRDKQILNLNLHEAATHQRLSTACEEWGASAAALISYVRRFAHGKRYRLSEDVRSKLQGDPIGVHTFYKSLRDKHVAHSVNPFEEVAVGIVLPEPGSQVRAVHKVWGRWP